MTTALGSVEASAAPRRLTRGPRVSAPRRRRQRTMTRGNTSPTSRLNCSV
jgi:hypothetical protein